MVEKFDYLETQRDADELIEEFGQVGAIRRTVVTPPPNDWTPGTEVTAYYPIKVAVLPIEEKNVDGTLIMAGDQQALISPLGLTVTPQVGDIILINGEMYGEEYVDGDAWTVSSMKTLAPAAIVALYDAVVRR